MTDNEIMDRYICEYFNDLQNITSTDNEKLHKKAIQKTLHYNLYALGIRWTEVKTAVKNEIVKLFTRK